MDKFKRKPVVKPFARWLLMVCVMTGPSVLATAAETGPLEMLQDLTAQLVEITDKHPDIFDDPAALRRIANDVVLPHIDFVRFSRQVLGKYWRRATPAQQADFVREFRELLLGTYIRSISAYKGNTIRFLPLHGGQQADRAVVKALVEQNNGPEVHIAFRLHKAAGEWKIYDFLAEGISLVATHRSTFSREIHNKGIDNVIEQLRMKNESNARQQVAGAGPG